MRLINKNELTKLFKATGAERISDPAKEVLIAAIIEIIQPIIARSIELSNFAGRKTVKDIDIKMALK